MTPLCSFYLILWATNWTFNYLDSNWQCESHYMNYSGSLHRVKKLTKIYLIVEKLKQLKLILVSFHWTVVKIHWRCDLRLCLISVLTKIVIVRKYRDQQQMFIVGQCYRHNICSHKIQRLSENWSDFLGNASYSWNFPSNLKKFPKIR